MVVWKRDIKNKAKCKPRAEELPGGSAKGINLRNVVLNLETYYTQGIYSYTNINQLLIYQLWAGVTEAIFKTWLLSTT